MDLLRGRSWPVGPCIGGCVVRPGMAITNPPAGEHFRLHVGAPLVVR